MKTQRVSVVLFLAPEAELESSCHQRYHQQSPNNQHGVSTNMLVGAHLGSAVVVDHPGADAAARPRVRSSGTCRLPPIRVLEFPHQSFTILTRHALFAHMLSFPI